MCVISRALFILLVAIIHSTDAYAQWRVSVENGDTLRIFRFPSAADVDVDIEVYVHNSDGVYEYSYGLESSSESGQDLWQFNAFTDSEVTHILAPVEWGGKINGRRRCVNWWARSEEAFLKPGETAEGFSYMSADPPAIIEYSMRGWFDIPELEAEPDSVENSSIFENSLLGTTVGPVALPDDLPAPVLLDTLTSYLTRSFEQGWVAHEGLRRSLQAKLDAARRQLAHGNSQAAVNVLEAFVNEVEAQREKQLSGEAYALLRFNAAYLIEHIE